VTATKATVEEISFVYLGNGSKGGLGQEDTGEPFVISEFLTDNSASYVNVGVDCTSIVVKKMPKEIVHKIDPKYYDRLGWVDTTLTEIFPETTITIVDDQYMQMGLIGLQEGKTYIVNWNGTRYECGCVRLSEGDISLLIIGNLSVLGMNDTGEPFVIADSIKEDGHMIVSASGDGDYIISIIEYTETIHKVDEKFLPFVVKDYDENVPISSKYIENRPCYNGMLKVDLNKLISGGAPVCTTIDPNRLPLNYIKVCEYMPCGNWVYDCEDDIGNQLGTMYMLVEEEYGWSFTDLDGTIMFGISKDAVANGEIIIDIGVPVLESGIYIGFLNNITMVNALPMIKTLDLDMISIGYDNLNNKPFGDYSNEHIVLYQWHDNTSMVATKWYNGETICEFDRLHWKVISINDIVGARLILSDGTEKVVAQSDIIKYEDGTEFWEVENTLLSIGNVRNDIIIGEFEYHVPSHTGLYVNNASGIDIVEIILPAKTKQIDKKYLPDTIPKIESAEVGQSLVVKSVDENGKPTEWETINSIKIDAQLSSSG